MLLYCTSRSLPRIKYSLFVDEVTIFSLFVVDNRSLPNSVYLRCLCFEVVLQNVRSGWVLTKIQIKYYK